MTSGYFKTISAAAFLTAWMAGGAQAEPPMPLSSFEAPCNAWGTPATCKSSWSAGKHKSHVIQEYSISTESGAQMFAGRGLYRFADGGKVTGFWEDSQGSIHPLTGEWDGSTLTINWGSAETELGRSAYVFGAQGGMTSTDWVLREDKEWHQFMTVTYTPNH